MTRTVQASQLVQRDTQVKNMEKRMIAVVRDMNSAKKMLVEGRKAREETYKELQNELHNLENSFSAYEKDLKEMNQNMAQLNKNLRRLDRMVGSFLTKPETE